MFGIKKSGKRIYLFSNQAVAGVIFAAVLIIGFILLWVRGTTTLWGIPLQISIITLAIPLCLGALLLWVSRQLDHQTWQSDNEE